MPRLIACRRFPGSVFEWDGLEITRHKAGVQVLDPFTALWMDRFTYFVPLAPIPKHGKVACQGKRLVVQDVVDVLQGCCKGGLRVIDVDD